ncbi:tellurite resistance TerB family protein [Haliangium ochraceum]|uniref:Co-chaperone DjlA N-terminal domain-containing protein n=1 Tax=Haliangium ochraceum (strain DSM 14365 / JCM 11303 / SMP-2) TaxID=502025 RepID=D0LHY7_HALO1|nr:TerB family tellurite resistance protein [Haliangium ochraceum]ACY14816.1 hypothetical protein Hoch_2273 [Haliangium ochraceum DSM 14365]
MSDESNKAKARHAEAIATWKRFDESISNDVLRAVSGAFALVACADGRFSESEIEAFLSMIKDTRAFEAEDLDVLEEQFRSLGRSILADFDEGRRLAMAELAVLERGDREQTALVVSAAQIAMVADGRLDDVEEMVLAQICEALGLDPRHY